MMTCGCDLILEGAASMKWTARARQSFNYCSTFHEDQSAANEIKEPNIRLVNIA